MTNNLAGLYLAIGTFAVSFAIFPCSLSSRELAQSEICEAIANSQAVTLWYKPGQGARKVRPLYLAYNRDGEPYLGTWQISGYSSSGNIPGYRTFKLDSMADMQFTDEKVETPTSMRLARYLVGHCVASGVDFQDPQKPLHPNCPFPGTFCSEISSCPEACFFLHTCDFRYLDGNEDGVPCQKLCQKPCP